MPAEGLTPKREPPRHPNTDPAGPDTMPPRPKPPIGRTTEKEESEAKKKERREIEG